MFVDQKLCSFSQMNMSDSIHLDSVNEAQCFVDPFMDIYTGYG